MNEQTGKNNIERGKNLVCVYATCLLILLLLFVYSFSEYLLWSKMRKGGNASGVIFLYFIVFLLLLVQTFFCEHSINQHIFSAYGSANVRNLLDLREQLLIEMQFDDSYLSVGSFFG